MKRARLILGGTWLLVSCTPILGRAQPGTGNHEAIDPAKLIVDAVLESHPLCGPSGFHEGCGPLLVDLASFRHALATVDSTPVETWFPVSVQDLPSSQAYECKVVHPDGMTSCMMLHSGIHAQVVASSREDRLLTLDVRFSWHTRSGAVGGGSGIDTTRFVFERVGEEWRLEQIILIQAT
jgi:hypothetical protein